MEPSAESYVPMMTSEAQIFRMLLRAHAARELRKHGHDAPAGLAISQLPPPSIGKYQLVEYSELEQTFCRVVAEFEARYGERIASHLRDWPSSESAVETFIVGVMEEMLAGSRAEWGCVIATASFLVHVAICCSEHDMSNHIGTLIDYAVQLADVNLMEFIREHGGWTSFTLAFRNEHHDTVAQPSSTVQRLGILASLCTLL